MYAKTFKLDSSGDVIYSELNRVELISGAEKVAQDIWVILHTIKGSDIFNPELGVDYFKIVESGYNRKIIEYEIRRALRNYPYLRSIDSIEVSEPDSNRRVTISIRLTIVSGESVSVEVTI
jgi:phage baseplate assembly protein W